MVDSTCVCGSPGTQVCHKCGKTICARCRRRDDTGFELCVGCRSGAIKREELRAEELRRGRGKPIQALSSGRIRAASSRRDELKTETRRRFRTRRINIVLPAAAVALLAGLAAVLTVGLVDADGARAEHRAREALRAIYEAEQAFRHAAVQGRAFADLPELERRHLVASPVPAPGYRLRVELAKDAHTFWVRAIPETTGLRGMVMDERGIVLYEDGRE